MFDNFFGNQAAVETLETMIGSGRIPQTMLLAGPEGIGKATLARRFAQRLLGKHPELIEADDLSLSANVELIAEREKLPSDKRSDDPLTFNTHSDFATFPPDGPLRQISIQQMRLLKERARFGPLHGRRRVFLIDQIDRANDQAANSLLKVLEEPPDHMVFILTASNPYDLLTTIRSRSIPLYMTRLTPDEVAAFLKLRGADNPDRRARLASGCPGAALSLDLAAYDKRRAAMLGLLETASGKQGMGAWAKFAEPVAASRSEKLESYLKVLYVLLQDLLLFVEGGDLAGLRNFDAERELSAIAAAVDFEWIRIATGKVDELAEFARRNIQKGLALDAFAVSMREAVRS